MQLSSMLPKPSRRTASRYWEIDAARGLAVILMVYFHLMWNLYYFGVSQVDVFSAGWQGFARGIGSAFMLLLGLSLAIRREKVTGELGPYLRRAAQIFGCGLLVTAVTFVAMPQEYIVFGILHLQGVALLIAYASARLPAWANVLGGLAAVAIGAAAANVFSPDPWLIPFGVQQYDRAMADYYPLFPWLAPALFGVATGKLFYPGGQRSFALPELGGAAPLRWLRFLGRHSLIIYLLHQPLIFAALALLGLGSL